MINPLIIVACIVWVGTIIWLELHPTFIYPGFSRS
jgi:hypothetical protein